MDVAKRHQDQLGRITGTIRKAHDYFRPNYDRYNKFRKFVFETSLRQEEITLLSNIGRPQLEFNILEAYISRLLGEFYKQEPDIEVSADDPSKADPIMISLVEQHLRHFFSDDNNQHTRYECYKQLLSGGFSVLKVFTDYSSPMSFDQVIKLQLAEPTLCAFDMNARLSHKGDGLWCSELFPMQEEEFKATFPKVSIRDVSFRRDFAGFNWSYLNGNDKIIMVAHYYEKSPKDVKILKLRDGRTMSVKDYERMQAQWTGFEEIPAPIGKSRTTRIDTINRYCVIENKVLEFEETDMTYLPLVFVDGNSAMIKTSVDGSIRQFTRPYVYHAESAQRLKNYAGISLANEIENLVQHKFIIKKEAIPKEEEFTQALKDIQRQSNIVVNGVYEENPDMPIMDPIREVMRPPAPPEILQGFSSTDSVIQNILGSYDSSIGINNNQLSGIAIIESASQSNAAAMPYIVGLLHGLQRCAQIYVDLMPKYFTTPRTLPIMDNEGKRSYIFINSPNGLSLNYDPYNLNVSLKAGASFQVQKSRTIMMIKEMMGMSPIFAQFIADKGLNFVLDNMEGKGVDQLKSLVDEWQQEMQKQKQMEQAQAQNEIQNNPLVQRNKLLEQQLALSQVKTQNEFVVDMMKIKQEDQKMLLDMHESMTAAETQKLKAETELAVHQVDAELKHRDQRHNHAKDLIDMHHKTNKGDHNAETRMDGI